ncbi:hypothetical protein Rsub_08715 [Raphidocelis subcapitata]|uniref:K Homology domain-containing protein n=1 Tax=Raphidocelis subcapitata TaxID=307507 RepID=A0A2V0PCV2_9CHLO|nr:hypothetical protein Rsub_08715 [Raphidocelis subcapitata]|eukprot:GBF95733.1 hypothetical protein Rsub_08715 [Raphidocelis subcapitata]
MAAELKRQTATVDCPKSMVGRVIGKNGETIKALQTYSGALIQIDQTVEPTKVTISGTPHSLGLAVSMVTDIVKGTFKGFALLRQVTNAGVRPMGMPPAAPIAQPRPVYAPGYGLIPPSQLYGADDRTAGVVAVGRQLGAMAWPPGGQVVPSQVIMGMPQSGGGMRQLAGQGAVLAGGMGGMDEATMMAMGGYMGAMPAPMYAAYPGPADYGMGVGVMSAPSAADVVYAGGGMEPAGVMGMAPVGAGARMYGAAASPRPANGLPHHGGGPRDGSSSELCDALGTGGNSAGGGNWVQIMDPDGKVYLVNQATGAAS